MLLNCRLKLGAPSDSRQLIQRLLLKYFLGQTYYDIGASIQIILTSGLTLYIQSCFDLGNPSTICLDDNFVAMQPGMSSFERLCSIQFLELHYSHIIQSFFSRLNQNIIKKIIKVILYQTLIKFKQNFIYSANKK